MGYEKIACVHCGDLILCDGYGLHDCTPVQDQNTAQYSVINGWTCEVCQAWFPNNVTHVCPGRDLSGTSKDYQPWPKGFGYDFRMIQVLERIADALEKIEKRMK